MRALVACLMMIVVATPAPAAAKARMGKAERAVVKRINNQRAKHALPGLSVSSRLAKAADAHSRDMVRAGFFAHNSSNGRSTYDRVRSYRRSTYVGETIGYIPTAGNPSPRAIVRMWMQSAPHRSTLLTRRLRRVGVAKRRGRLFGQRVVVWTLDLTSRR